MKTFHCNVRGFESSIDSLGWLCQVKYKDDDVKKFQCATCGKKSRDKNEICKTQDGIGAGCLYVSRLQ